MVLSAEAVAALDACLDRFLKGQDWLSALPEDEARAQVRELMQVAELVFSAARQTPGLAVPLKEGLLSRLRARLLETRRHQVTVGGIQKAGTAG